MKQRRVSQIKNLSRYPTDGLCAILIPLSLSFLPTKKGDAILECSVQKVSLNSRPSRSGRQR
jgi:hypothetical protein